MTRMHFVSAHFGGPVPWDFHVTSDTVEVSTAYYTDSNTPSRHLAMHPRLKSKIPKMIEVSRSEISKFDLPTSNTGFIFRRVFHYILNLVELKIEGLQASSGPL